MSDVGFLAGEEVVQTNYVVPFLDQSLAEMRTEKTGPAGNENTLKRRHLLILFRSRMCEWRRRGKTT
jgi:hypothetical protein